MTRKHITLIMNVFKSSRPLAVDYDAWEQWRKDLLAMALMISTINPKFDLERFKEGCGL